MKKITLSILFTCISFNSFGALNLKPGLWEIKMKINSGGKQIDPSSEVAKAMKNLPADTQEKMAKMMGKTDQGKLFKGYSNEGMQVCFTKEMLEKPSSLHRDPEQKCETTVTKQTASNIEMSFKCKDGSRGTGEWTLSDSTHYLSKMNFTQKDGTKTYMNQEGKFVQANCTAVQ